MAAVAQLFSTAMKTEKEAEIAMQTAEGICASVTIVFPPLEALCAMTIELPAASDVGLFIITWALKSIATKFAAEDFCLATRQCKYPCSPSRSAVLTPRGRLLQNVTTLAN